MNSWLAAVASPPIPEAKTWLAAYDGRSGPPIDLSQAVPADPPPPELRSRLAEAAGDAASAGYGPIVGDGVLREAYAAHVSTIYRGVISPADVMITAGCNLAFVMALMTAAQAGDSVILPTPWYFNHAMALGMLGINVQALSCRPEEAFIPNPDDAEILIGSSTRAIVLVSPNNPTGAVYPPNVIARFSRLCATRGLTLILDETYRDFLPQCAVPPHELFAVPARERVHVVQLYSFSKAYGIPGHRLGAMLVPEIWRPQISKVLDTLQICPPRPGQIACAWAISALAERRTDARDEILSRGEAFHNAFRQLSDWEIGSLGAYFAYVRHPFSNRSSSDVARSLAEKCGVLALPGSYFEPHDHGFLRFAFANADSPTIQRLAERLTRFQPG